MNGEQMSRRPYQKGLIRDAGGQLSGHGAGGAEPREGHVGESPAPHAAAVVGDFKRASLMVIQTASWNKKIRVALVQP